MEIQYLVKFISAKTKCTIFDKLRFENDTRKKASLINLPLAFNSVKGHLYRCFFNIQEQNSVFNKTGSHANPCKFCWGIDGDVAFRQDKMLLSMLKHYTLRCGCKSKCTKQCNCKKNEVDCTEFCKCKGLSETWKDILKKNFWRKGVTTSKKKKIVLVFADFFLLYVYYDFTLILFSYRNYSIQKLCRKENRKRSFLYFTRISFILCFLNEMETTF